MQFWDSSALLPVVVRQGSLSRACADALGGRAARLISFVARIECHSALQRLSRTGALSPTGLRDASAKLEALLVSFDVVAFSVAVERSALVLLRRHALRSLDSIQLACALAVAATDGEDAPQFACCDRQLARAASAEGFVLPILVD